MGDLGTGCRFARARRRFLAGCGALLVSASAAAAEPPPVHPTSFETMAQSMQELLDGGYRIVNLSAGLGGYAYLLTKDGKWVTCAVQPAENDPKSFVSQCLKMN